MAPKKKAGGDAEKGAKIFKAQCAVCHSVNAHGTGPMVKGTFGNVAATKEGFAYS